MILQVQIGDNNQGTQITLDFGNDFVNPSNEECVALAKDILRSDAIQHIKWREAPQLVFVTTQDTHTETIYPPAN